MSKKEKPSKAEVNRRIKERVSNAQLQQIILRVIDLMGRNYTTMQICGILGPELNKSETQIKRYVSKATGVIKKDFNREADIRRIEMETSLRKDLNTAYEQFELATSPRDKNAWFKSIQEVKDRILKFAPIEEKDDNQTITIQYKKVDNE